MRRILRIRSSFASTLQSTHAIRSLPNIRSLGDSPRSISDIQRAGAKFFLASPENEFAAPIDILGYRFDGARGFKVAVGRLGFLLFYNRRGGSVSGAPVFISVTPKAVPTGVRGGNGSTSSRATSATLYAMYLATAERLQFV